jgi:hypothetical protein
MKQQVKHWLKPTSRHTNHFYSTKLTPVHSLCYEMFPVFKGVFYAEGFEDAEKKA